MVLKWLITFFVVFRSPTCVPTHIIPGLPSCQILATPLPYAMSTVSSYVIWYDSIILPQQLPVTHELTWIDTCDRLKWTAHCTQHSTDCHTESQTDSYSLISKTYDQHEIELKIDFLSHPFMETSYNRGKTTPTNPANSAAGTSPSMVL